MAESKRIVEAKIAVVYYKGCGNTDEAISKASKEELAECARLLALNVAHYRQKYGELPLEEQEELLNATDVAPETAKLLTRGMLQLLSSLAVVMNDGEAFEEIEAMKGQFH